ncbi:MAG: alpha/beta fold hydrolase [Corynebacteriales bacterium]|uniref:Lipase family protein n=1 Tax=Williamsia herbipolensis TaxID=1603258 RepID=A0AAU4K089_9NOCA|nr:alpha/beta fold hydrolase [Williamsia herbipolensis]MCX6471384.1 alpha/beta fold hydrolase [Mycobacteriales bacterium]
MAHGPLIRLLGDAMTIPLRVGGLLTRSTDDVGVLAPDQEIDNPAPPNSAHERQKIAYNFFSGIGPEIANPGGALPGANRWDDPVDPAHPNPVILVHGTGGGGQTNWGTYVPLLTAERYAVFTLTYGALPHLPWPLSAMGGMTAMEDSAAELGDFIDRVLASTGADKVDIVGHSQGTLVPNHYAKFLGGADKIDRYVSLAPLWEGTSAFGAGLLHTVDLRLGIEPLKVLPCRAVSQMTIGSAFLAHMNADGGPYVPGIRYTNISTRFDEFVRPYTSGQLPATADDQDVTNIVVQSNCTQDFCDHLGICGSPRSARHVLNALDPDHTEEVPCVFVPPFFG